MSGGVGSRFWPFSKEGNPSNSWIFGTDGRCCKARSTGLRNRAGGEHIHRDQRCLRGDDIKAVARAERGADLLEPIRRNTPRHCLRFVSHSGCEPQRTSWWLPPTIDLERGAIRG